VRGQSGVEPIRFICITVPMTHALRPPLSRLVLRLFILRAWPWPLYRLMLACHMNPNYRGRRSMHSRLSSGMWQALPLPLR